MDQWSTAAPPAQLANVRNGSAALGHFDSWTADGVVANNVLQLHKSELVRGKDAASVSGTISFARELKLSYIDQSTPVTITGLWSSQSCNRNPLHR